ncbi:unnamed protein product [Gordionus sp. m RMFG-2023]
MDVSTQTNISFFSSILNVCTAECQTIYLQVLDNTNSPVLENTNSLNKFQLYWYYLFFNKVLNQEILEEIDAHNRNTTSPGK